MSDKIYFMFERMEPKRYPEPRDVRIQLEKFMVSKYQDISISKITLSTEIILKSLKPKDGSLEKPLLKYKIINIDWEETRKIKDIKFNKKMFRWQKGDEQKEHEDTGSAAGTF